MKPEPKSIFTSKESFGSQSEQKERASRKAPALKPSEDLSSGGARDTATSDGQRRTLPHPQQWSDAPTQGAQLAALDTPLNRGPREPPDDKTMRSVMPSADLIQADMDPRKPVLSTQPASRHKRSYEHESQNVVASELAHKRPRHRMTSRHTIDPATLPTGIAGSPNTPVSPLFFSHTPKRRPALLPSFSSSEAATRMLDNAREESSSITTLKLARGSINTASPPRSVGTPGSWKSLARNSNTPESSNSSLQILAGVGIFDLLEQDDRPTFIIDLGDPSNFNPEGPLQILFANASLRGYEKVFETLKGKTGLDMPGAAGSNTFSGFKSWALSFVKNSESSGGSSPSFLYGGLEWTYSTLKRRLRLIKGNTNSLHLESSVSASISTTHNIVARGDMESTDNLPEFHEPQDYFGNAVPYPQEDTRDLASSSALVTEDPKFKMGEDSLVAGASTSLGDSHSTTALSMDLTSPPITPDIPELLLYTPPSNRLESQSFDWTSLPMSSALPPHIQFARSIDWASTDLGPIETWNFDLRAMCNLVMASPHPAAMYWGDEYTAIYNEAYVLLAGQKHPDLMGQSYKMAWSEIWEDIKDIFVNAKESGQATMKDDDCLFIMRNGYIEESYFSWSIVPLVGEDGSVVGLYNPAFEKTRRKIAERRMLTLREVGERCATAREVKGFWRQVLQGLEYNDYDVPFVFLYSVTDEVDSDMSSMHSGSLSATPQCVLEGTLGVPEGHRTTVNPLDLRTSNEAWAPYLREAMKTDKPILLTTDDGTLSDLIDGLKFRGFGDPCRAAVVCPIHPTTGDTILGFLVMGINPRRPYDDDYSLFIQLLSRQLATSMASVVLFEEEIRRGQKAAKLAAQDRIELSKQLDLRTQEVAESETKFTRMAEFAPVAMFIANSDGRITFSNDAWWLITRHPKETNSVDTWMDSVMDEDRVAVESMWRQVVIENIQISAEFRVKAPWQDPNGVSADTWVLMNAYPEKDTNGDLKSVFGCLTNISQQKYAEDFQKRRMEEAVELKRQQENFIDMTSHEMRNPLSAILQCADEIISTLSKYRRDAFTSTTTAERDLRQGLEDILDSSIDAAQTISLCAQHQKRIVDDVLTLSKLDSALLLVTPVDVQPVSVVQRALKMFEAELDTNDISLEFQVEPSYTELKIDWVKLDPSRLLQVLINLTTNAIKFTHTQSRRTIVVSVGASKEMPENTNGNEQESSTAATSAGVAYFPSRSTRNEVATGDDWGTGEEIYIHFAVQDTGRGLDEDEKMLLFRRFSQASPRTHVQYGGSGLGLFISRELTELQGGEIGVASERGVGSTFAFYVKARRAPRPNNVTLSSPPVMQKNSEGKNVVVTGGHKNSSGRTNNRMAQPSSQQVRPGISRSSSVGSSGGSTLNVLIVEDNLVNQRVLQKQLRNLGCTTYVANHGGEALTILEGSQFWTGHELDGFELTVILMDLEMPVMDGLTCARRIREFEAAGTIVKHVPIIAVTANARLEQIETAKTAGMVSCHPVETHILMI